MMKFNLLIIFLLFLIVVIYGIDEDLFDDLWKNLKTFNPKNSKKPKFGEINAIKEEIIDNNEMHEQQNANKIEMEEKELQKNKKEPLEEGNNNLKIKKPKNELDQLSEKSFENEFNEQAYQKVLSTDQSNSGDDADYTKNMEAEKRKEMDFLNKFILMKTELRKENVYKNWTNVKIECNIAKKFGTTRAKIYKLKKKLGQKKEKRTEESEETKMELIRKFNEIKKEKICGFKYDIKKINKIENEIAIELGINRTKIYQLKKEIGLSKGFSNQQKLEKIKQFEKIKEEFSKRFNLKTNWKINEKIAEKIGVGLSTIYGWKRKLDVITRKSKIYTDAEQLEYVKRSEEMRKRNTMMSERKVAKKLGIPNANLRRWTKN